MSSLLPRSLQHLVAWALLILLCLPAYAQTATGRIAGRVTDAATGEPLPGATVLLVGTMTGAVADAEGEYLLDAVPAGTATVRARLVGYASLEADVQVPVGSTAGVSFAMETATIGLGEVLAVADRPYSAASSRSLRAFDIQTRPARSTQDLLRLAPGLVVAQHAGGGKAEQIFLRGFDADHGTDVAVYVDGIPVNNVSHGHGQGYADLHHVIPETVEAIDVYKGPYFPAFGNLATAGAVAFKTRDHLDASSVRAEVGGFGTAGLTGLVRIPTPAAHPSAYAAGSFYTSDGPFEEPQQFRRFNVFGKVHAHPTAASTLALDVAGYGAAWDASGQVPERAVRSGLIGRFGAIDALEGGTTGHRHANVRYGVDGPDGQRLDVQAYGVRYDFKLFSNFPFFLENPDEGDMIEQTDERTTYGAASTYRTPHRLPVGLGTATVGAGFRADDVAVSLWQSPDRARVTQLVDADVQERNFFLWGQEEWVTSRWLRVLAGLRADYFTFDVEDRFAAVEDAPGGLPHASGYAQEVVVSPKGSVVLSPFSSLDLFVNAGVGFHSNDARDVVIAQQIRTLRAAGTDEAALEAMNFDPAQADTPVLPRAVGGEVGARVRLFGDRLTFGAALWRLDLDREFVFVGDAGTTELSGRTERVGVDLDARAALLPWLAADADVTLSRGRFPDEPDGADAIPLAPRVTFTGGLTVQRESGLEGSLRVRAVGDRPANETDTITAEGYAIVDLLATLPVGPLAFTLALENALDAEWNEAQFATESRLPGEAASVDELHYTPGNPRNVRLGVTYRF